VFLLGGCSLFQANKVTHGNKIDPDALKELVIGTSSRADAESLLGSPTAHGTFDDNTWIYISEVTRQRIARTPGVLTQNVYVLTFDQAGTLRGIKHMDLADAEPVDMVSRTTPSPGSEATFMQQLLGNVGKFSPGVPGSGGTGGGDNQSGAPGQ
jgi:outer membrane protein assembly factor BamE (lipoprotein component of BamABCDE complex)